MRHILALAAVGWTAAVLPASAQNQAAVLQRMDAAAPSFRSMSAKMTRQNHVAIINDTTEEVAAIRMTRSKGKEIRVLLEFQAEDSRQVEIGVRKAQVFYPKMNTVQEWDLGKYKSAVDQFTLLGFGTSGKELEKAHGLRYIGEETVAGQKCSHLELSPKNADFRKLYKTVELWIADPGGYPVRQKFTEPSGNYSNVVYTELKLNPDLKPEQMALKLPKDVKREYPQR